MTLSLLLAAATLVNAAFECGEAGWTLPKDAWRMSAAGGRDDSGCVVWENRDPKAFSYAKQDLALEPGVSYEFGAWTKVEDGQASPHVALGWCDASNKWISCEFAQPLEENDPTTKGWVRHEGRTAPLPAAACRGLLHFHMSRGQTGRVKFDSFWIRPRARVVVPYFVTSAYRNGFAHGDGKIRFLASLNLNAATTPLDTLQAEIVFRDAKGGRAIRPAETFEAASALFSVEADDFALGRQEVVFRLRTKADGKVFAEKGRAVEVTAKTRTRRVRLDARGRLFVDGKATLPIGCFSGRMTPKTFTELRRGPFNFLMPYGLATLDEMSLALSNGVYTVPCVMHKIYGMKYQSVDTTKTTREETLAFFRDYVGKTRAHPGLLGWFIIDELPRAYVPNVAEVNDLLQELDPDHPTWAVTDKPGHAGDLLPCYDLLAMDPYPVGNRGDKGNIAICSDWTHRARALMRDFRPMWIVPQAFDWSWYRPEDRGAKGVRMPTRAEIANMTWQGVAAGANGVCFYSHGTIFRFAPEDKKAAYWEDVCAVAREIKAMEDVLVRAEDAAPLAGVPKTLEVRTWRLDGQDRYLVVNRTREPVKATLALPRPAGRIRTACGGGVAVRDGRLKVDFEGLGYAFVTVEAEGPVRELTLAAHGQSDYAIVLDADAPNEVTYAAEEFQRFVAEQTGAKLPIRAAAAQGRPPCQEAKGKCVRLAATDRGAHDWFRVRAAGDDLEVTGNARGVLYGAYEILRRFGGCEWFSRSTAVIPKLVRFTVPAETDFSERAAFLLRDTSWHDVAMDSAFGMRLRFNGPRVLGSDNKKSPPVCRVHWPLGMCHTVTRLCPPKLYAKDHPEYYALRDGRRHVSDREQAMQLCLTNPEVLAIVTSNVLAAIRRSPQFDVYGVSQNDNVGYCQCARCAAVDAEEGSHAGTNIRFVNAVADAVAKEFPDKFVETLAYQYGRKVPQKTKPRDNVMICLCSLELDFSRPILASGNPENVAFRDDIRDWRRIAKHLYVWDYTVNFNHYLAIHPNLKAIHGNVAFFRDAGVTHLFEQGNGQTDGAWFAELKAWVIAQLLWKSDQPLAPLLDRFFDGFYGAAAPLVRQYYEEAAAYPRDEIAEKLGFNNKIIQPKSMPYVFLDRAAATLADAAARVKDDPVRRANVEELVYANDYMRAILTARGAGGVFLSRHPERLDAARLATAKPLAKKILARSSEKKLPGYVRLAEEETVVQPALADLRRLASFEIPTGGVDRVRLEESELRVPECNRGTVADDPAAKNGRAIRLFGTCFDWTSGFDFAPCVFDADARYRVRVRVRVDAVSGQSGEAFSFGIYNYAQKRRAFADRRVRTTDLKTADYTWYELPAWKPETGDRLWFAAGEFKKGSSPAVRDVWIDAIEIVRTD